MPSRSYYRQQAKAYFDMATMSRDEAMRARWIERANEYLILADALGDDPMPDNPEPVQQQPQQQQQQQQGQPKDGAASSGEVVNNTERQDKGGD